jgi:SSS family solute:Na+ symporter
MSQLDWIIFIGLLAGLVWIGWSFRRYMRSVADFLVVNRCMRTYLGVSTWGAEAIGLISIAYIAEQGFTSGIGLAWMTLLNMALYIPLFGVIGLGIRRFRATNVQTIPQYHELRFSRGVRICNGIVLATGGILNMAIFPSVSSQFLLRFMGLPASVELLGVEWQSAQVAMMLLVCISLAIALMGGMVTVIVTDYVQSLILALTLFIITAFSIWHVGVSGIDRTLRERFGEAGFNPFVTTGEGDGYGLTWVVFFILSGILAPLCFPPSTTKLAATDSTNTTRRLALLNQVLSPGRTMLVLLWGVCALAAMGGGTGDATVTGDTARYATADFAHSVTPSGLLGLCAAGMVFAYVATSNSYFLAWAAIVVNDIVAPLRKQPLSQQTHIRLLRVVMVCIAAFLLVWGLLYDPEESLLGYIYLTGAIMTGAAIVTFFGLYWRRANSAGAYLTVAFCLILPIADLIGKKIVDDYPLKGHESGLIALLLSFAAFIVCGLVSRSGEARWHNYGEEVREEDRLRHAAAAGATHA